MSNYIEYKDKVAFNPGYYIKEQVISIKTLALIVK